jgi:hypothetical protein
MGNFLQELSLQYRKEFFSAIDVEMHVAFAKNNNNSG